MLLLIYHMLGHCLSDCLTKRSANPKNLMDAVKSGWLKELDCSMLEHKAFLNAWLSKELSGYNYVSSPCFLLTHMYS